MSLVLNANKTTITATPSNDFLEPGSEVYPDFNQVLIYPYLQSDRTLTWMNCSEVSWNNNKTYWPWEVGFTALNVNWTIINFIDETLYDDTAMKWNYTGNNVGGNYIFNLGDQTVSQANSANQTSQWSESKTVRFGTKWVFTDGMVFWKRFLWIPYMQYSSYFANTNFFTTITTTRTFKIKRWLLHSDWSISYAGEYSETRTKTWAFSEYRFWSANTNPMIEWSSDWIITQNGDRAIVDITLANTWNASWKQSTTWWPRTWRKSSYNSWGVQFKFWYRGNTWEEFPRPFQISVE